MGAKTFLHTLFGNKPKDAHILIWEKGEKQKTSHWFKDLDNALEHIREHGKDQDTYVGCGVSGQALTAYQRCKANDIAGIPGAWLDIDIQDSVHKKTNLPKNEEEALAIVNSFPLKPTIIIHSGHGFQCWWVFEKFVSFKSHKVRDEADDLLYQFQWTMRDKARSMNCEIDMTHDLSRVLRIPETFNHKTKPPVPVVLTYSNGNFCNPVEFRNSIKELRITLGDAATPIGERVKETPRELLEEGEFVLDPKAVPPEDKFDVLMAFEPRFKASWNKERKDFEKKDNSPSVYDLSLATFAAYAEWTIQEVVDLLIAFRRKHGLDLKLRKDYYQATYNRAYSGINRENAAREIQTLWSDVSPENREKIVAEAKEHIKTLLGIDLIEIMKYMMDPPEYKLVTTTSCIHLGPIQNVIEENLVRRKIADVTGHVIPYFKREVWNAIANALTKIVREIPMGEETTTKGQMRAFINRYLQQYAPVYDMEDVYITYKSYFLGHYLYIFGYKLREYLAMYLKEYIAQKTMGIMLKEYGFEPLQVHFQTKEGKRASRSVYRIDIQKDETVRSFVDDAMLGYANKLHLERETEKEKMRTSVDDF